MHKLEITGATPEDLFMNAVRMLSVLLKGGGTHSVDPPPEPAKVEQEVSSTKEAAEAFAGLMSEAKKTKRGPKAKVEIPSDPLPDSMTGGTTIEHDANEVDGKPAQTLTLDDDIRPMLRAIQKACTDRGMNMADSVSYIQKLYGPFGITKADQLKPEAFVEFMDAAEAYLKGDA